MCISRACHDYYTILHYYRCCCCCRRRFRLIGSPCYMPSPALYILAAGSVKIAFLGPAFHHRVSAMLWVLACACLLALQRLRARIEWAGARGNLSLSLSLFFCIHLSIYLSILGIRICSFRPYFLYIYICDSDSLEFSSFWAMAVYIWLTERRKYGNFKKGQKRSPSLHIVDLVYSKRWGRPSAGMALSLRLPLIARERRCKYSNP